LTRINPKHARVATLWWSAPIQETTMYQRILVPVDGSATSDCGLDESIRLAKLTGARLRLVHVVDSLIFSTGMEFATADIVGILMGAGAEILATAKARVEASGVPVETFLSESLGSRICDVVVAQARLWKADLVVIGTHGRRGVGRLFIGSDAEQIVRVAPVPVLLVRPRMAADGTAAIDGAEMAARPADKLAA
jgi:nucleotide-binding universal stress UspA family protein